ncbi:30S ribosomal protein THX [Hufsiella ginkgonis]|uniref:30S ribosomal protein THX n=1 Tax=Hufsiella ginkgonis TaxID=2695274 RepID=A0A7K1Y035_9SPHI|nr:30S ribosomal protein THX [Hufsiella ginkgonis]
MGKGDKKSKKGKIVSKTFGKRRLRVKKMDSSAKSTGGEEVTKPVSAS